MNKLFRIGLKSKLAFDINLKKYSDLAIESLKLISVKNCRDKIEIQVGLNEKEAKTLKFDPHWLRFNCHSSSSRQPGSGQRTIQEENVPEELFIENAQRVENNLIIKWNSNSNQPNSVLPLTFLLLNHPSNNLVEKNSSKQCLPSTKNLKFFDFETFFKPDGAKNSSEIYEWLKELALYGVCILKGVECKENMVRQVAELIAPVQNTIYGELFDVKVEKQPINIAYSDAPLGFHMDLAYYESSPGLQFLHCIKFDEEIIGGESILLDSFKVADDFKRAYPDNFRTLTKTPVTFQKLHLNRSRPVCMVYQRPHIVVNNRDEIVGVNWSPPFEGPLKNLTEEEIKAYYKSYLKFSKFLNSHPDLIEYKLKPGEVLCFNNRRVLHGRRGFSSNNGARFLQGCYVNIDEFKSEVFVKEFIEKNSSNIKNKEITPNISLFSKIPFGNNDLN